MSLFLASLLISSSSAAPSLCSTFKDAAVRAQCERLALANAVTGPVSKRIVIETPAIPAPALSDSDPTQVPSPPQTPAAADAPALKRQLLDAAALCANFKDAAVRAQCERLALSSSAVVGKRADATEEPATVEPATEEPATEEPEAKRQLLDAAALCANFKDAAVRAQCERLALSSSAVVGKRADATEEPATVEPATEEPSTEEPATEEPEAKRQLLDAAALCANFKDAAVRAQCERLALSSSAVVGKRADATEEPATVEPATEEPATEEPEAKRQLLDASALCANFKDAAVREHCERLAASTAASVNTAAKRADGDDVEPAVEEPSTEEPATEQPASEEPAEGKRMF